MHTVLAGNTPLQGLGGALQLVAPLAEGLLTVAHPPLHMGREHLHIPSSSASATYLVNKAEGAIAPKLIDVLLKHGQNPSMHLSRIAGKQMP